MRRLALLRALIVVLSTTSTAAFAGPDVVYVNGKVLTVDDQFSIAGGFAVESGRFVAVGDSAGIQKLADGTAFQDIPRWRRCSRDTPGFMELFCNMPRSPGLPMWG